MIIFQLMLTRRTFLKIVAQLSILITGSHYKKALASTEQQNTIAQAGNRIGNYDSSDYPGYTTYLPLISKEKQ